MQHETRTRQFILTHQKPVEEQGTRFTRSLAVIIGINEYANGIPRLQTAGNDAARLAETLLGTFGYDVLLLADTQIGQRVEERLAAPQSNGEEERASTGQLTNLGPATHTALRSLLTETLPTQLTANDRVLFYFAGHGVTLEGGDVEEGPVGYLIPQDARPDARDSFWPMTEFYDLLTELPCRHLLVILDCCFAGALRWVTTRDLQIPPQKIYRERYELFVKSRAWQAITSAAYDQKALDLLSGSAIGVRGEGIDEAHSPFALALFDALAGAGDTFPPGENGKPPGDGLLTANELYQYLRDNVELKAKIQANHPQSPGLWPLKHHHAGEYVFLMPHRRLELEEAPPLTFALNPYRGLNSFEEGDHALFFGRQALIEALAERVEAQSLTVVLGASGTGKSSVVKAGAVPFLRNAHHENRWQILPIMRPTATPLAALHACLETLTAQPDPPAANQPQPTDQIRANQPASASNIIASWSNANPNRHLLLVIDQFEELVTLCTEQQRTDFLGLLGGLLRTHCDQLHIVLTLRSDFEPQFAKALLPEAEWMAARTVIPAMSQTDLREAIVKPAEARVLYFDPPDLVDTLIQEVNNMPGALPLLSFTLSEMYIKYIEELAAGKTTDRALTAAYHQELGGVIGSLSKRATGIYEELDKDHQATMQRVMLRMVAVEGGEVARRRVPMDELVYPSAVENERVRAVIQRLVDARLAVTDSVDADRDGVADAYVEPAHDALVRAWDRLRRWHLVAEEELPLALHRNLTQIAGDWERAEEKSKHGLLWNENPWLSQLTERILPETNERIDALSYWLDPSLLFRILVQVTTKPTRFNQQESTFIQQSARRRSYLWRRTVGITLAVMVVLAGIAGVAELQRRAAVTERVRADVNAEEAQQNAKQAQENATTAQKNAVAAIAAEETAVAERNEAQRQARISRSEELAVYSQSRRTAQHYANDVTLILAHDAVATTLQDDGYVTANAAALMFDILADRPHWQQSFPRQKHTATISELAWSLDSKQLATADADGIIKVWDLQMNNVRHTLVGHTAAISRMAWSPDAIRLVSTSQNGSAILWDVQHGQIERQRMVSSGSILANAWSRDGRYVALSNAYQIDIWDTQSDQITSTQTGHSDQVHALAWSPQGTFLASGSTDGVIKIWNTATMTVQAERTVQHDQINSLAWHANEDRLAFAGTHTIGVWNRTPEGKFHILFDIEEVTIEKLFWSAKADQESALVATTSTGAVKFGTTEDEPTFIDLGEGIDRNHEIALSYDEHTFATSHDTTIELWDPEIGEQIATLGGGHTGAITAADWHPQGNKLATASDDGSVIVWDIQSGQELQYLSVYTDTVYAVRWNPDGDRLITTDSAEKAKVWDANNGQLLFILDHNCSNAMDDPLSFPGLAIAINGGCYLTAVAWSPDGKQIATAGSSRNIKIWDAYNGDELRSFPAHRDNIWSIDWSHDGQYLATASDDLTARIWAADSGTEVQTFSGHTAGIWSVRWSPDDQKIATAGWDNSTKIWDSDSGAEQVSLAHSGPVWSADWHPDGKRVLTIGWDSQARIWNANSGALLESVQVEGAGETIVIQEPASILGLRHIWSASWGPDGRSFLTTSSQQQINLWANDPSPVQSLLIEHGAPLFAVQWSPDNLSLLTAGEDGTAKVWSALSGYPRFELLGHEKRIRDAAWNPRGDQIATVSDDGTARIWNAQTGVQTQTLLFYRFIPFDLQGLPVYDLTVDWHPTQDQLAIAAEWYAKIWDISTLKAVLEVKHQNNENGWFVRGEDDVFSAQFNPKGDLLLTAGGDNMGHIWRVSSQREQVILEGHTDDVEFAEWSHDGRRIATGSSDGTAKIWHSNSGKALVTLTGHRGTINHLAWSHDDLRLSTASSDGTVKIWDTTSGVELFSLVGHQGNVMQVAWNNDDSLLATAGQDGTARIWWSNSSLWLAQINSRIQRNMTILSEDERWRYGYK